MINVGVSEPVRRSRQDSDSPCTSRSGLDELSPGIVTGVSEDQGTSQNCRGGQGGGTVIEGGTDVNMSDQVVVSPGIATGDEMGRTRGLDTGDQATSLTCGKGRVVGNQV
jgi:hypothetical protein